MQGPLVRGNEGADRKDDGEQAERASGAQLGRRRMVAGGPSPAQTLMFSGCVSIDSPEGLENIPEKWPLQVKRFCPHQAIVLAGSEEDLGKDEPTGGAAKMQQER